MSKTIELYSTKSGQFEEFELTIDGNNEVVATYEDELLKFPAGLTKAEFLKLVDKHNKANDGIVEIDLEQQEAEKQKAEKLLDSL